MRTVNMKKAKTHLRPLVGAATNGDPFVRARACKPLVKVATVKTPESGATCQTGFLDGKILGTKRSRMRCR